MAILNKWFIVNIYTRERGVFKLHTSFKNTEPIITSFYHDTVDNNLNTPYVPGTSFEYIELIHNDEVVRAERRTNYRM